MNRTTVATALVALLALAPAAGACVAPKKPMSFTVYRKNGTILLHKGQCVIDPSFWIYTPPPKGAPHETLPANPL